MDPARKILVVGLASITAASASDEKGYPRIGFETEVEQRAWRTVNDNVMGGRSIGGLNYNDNVLVFSGSINTNGGGFSSVRRDVAPNIYAGAQAFVLEVKSDGRRYSLIARTNERFQGRFVSYQATIAASNPGTYEQVTVPISDFVPTVFGTRVPASAFNAADINEIGFIIADGIDGEFYLSIRSISAV